MGKHLHFAISLFTVVSFGFQPVAFGVTFQEAFPGLYGSSSDPATLRSAKSPQGKSSKKSEFDQEGKACEDDGKQAAQQCDDKTNKDSQSAQQQSSQQQQQSGSGGDGAQGQCGGLGDLMKAIAPLLQKAGGDCKAANDKCKQSCKKAQQGSSKCAGAQDAAACQGDAQQNQQFGQKNEKTCGSQDANAAAFLAAAANAAMQAMQMAKCKKDTELDCTKPENAADPKCGPQTLDCSKPESATNPQCICQMNPRANGCPGAENANDASSASKEKKQKSSDSPGGGTPQGVGADGTATKPNSAAGGLPAGGSGGGAGGNKGADSNKGADGTGVKGLSSDILAGDYGGGGGAKITGGGYPDGDPRNAALAKGKKAVERRLAAQGAWTGSNGRSNWDKVKERYRDNRPSLLSTEH